MWLAWLQSRGGCVLVLDGTRVAMRANLAKALFGVSQRSIAAFRAYRHNPLRRRGGVIFIRDAREPASNMALTRQLPHRVENATGADRAARMRA
ncbi:hypothetical protein A6R71_07430 [Xanthomonas translucens pv. arrhenatheri]|nr:hypothetical protein A6R71_07430 [Xanthomonas translucens pv. arrhenatheri]